MLSMRYAWEEIKTTLFISMALKHILDFTEPLFVRLYIPQRSTFVIIRLKDLIELIFFRRNTSWSATS